jgi:hypothetical protein
MFISFGGGPRRSEKVVSNTCRNSFECLLDPREYQRDSYMCSLVVSQNSLDNLIFAYFSKYGLLYVFWKLLSRAFQRYITLWIWRKTLWVVFKWRIQINMFYITTHFKWRSMFLHWEPRENIILTLSSFSTLIETSGDFLGFKSINTDCS